MNPWNPWLATPQLAFEAFVRGRHEDLLRSAHRIAAFRGVAERGDDVYQDTAQRALELLKRRGPHTVVEYRSPEAWFIGIMFNIAHEVSRREFKNRYREPLVAQTDDPPVSAGLCENSTADLALSNVLFQEVVPCVFAELQPQTREAWQLWAAGRSHNEIALIQACAEGTVGARIFRVNTRLAQAYEQALAEEHDGLRDRGETP